MMDSGREPKPAYHEILALKSQSQIKFPKTLMALCLNTIRKNTYFFMKKHQGLTRLKQLPNSLKTEILGNDVHSEWTRWDHLLLNRGVTRLDIWMDPDTDVMDFTEFEISMMEKKPQLEEFIWAGSYNAKYDVRQDKFLFLTDDALPCFTELRSLSLFCILCNDSHLKLIASHLKKLRTLHLELDKVTKKGITAISTLQYLEEFPFETSFAKNGTNFKARMYSLCVKLMPKLKVVGHEKVCLETIDMDKEAAEGKNFHVDFKSIPTPTELGLRQLVLSCNKNVIPEGITFPNLTSLVILSSLKNFQLDNRFSKVTELGLFELGMAEYLRVLSILGQQIRMLTILEEDEDLALDLILRLCPNLEKFHIGMSPENLICTSPLDPEVHLLNLKELRFNLNNNSLTSGYPTFAPGVLVQLLGAPNLHLIKLYAVDLKKEETEMIVSLVQKGQILQNLQELVVVHGFLRKGEYFDEELRHIYDLVLDSMAKHCPHFVLYKENEQ